MCFPDTIAHQRHGPAGAGLTLSPARDTVRIAVPRFPRHRTSAVGAICGRREARGDLMTHAAHRSSRGDSPQPRSGAAMPSGDGESSADAAARAAYDPSKYERPSVTVDVVIL